MKAMTHLLPISALAFLGVCLCVTPSFQPTIGLADSSAMVGADSQRWHTDIDEALAVAHSSKRPLLLVFR